VLKLRSSQNILYAALKSYVKKHRKYTSELGRARNKYFHLKSKSRIATNNFFNNLF